MRHLILKENRVMMKNWLSYFISMFVPVLSVVINLIISSTAVIHMNVLIIEESDMLYNALSAEIIAQEGLEIEIDKADSLDTAIEMIKTKKASIVLKMDEDNEISIYYDETRPDSLGALQYMSAFIQRINTENMSEKDPELLEIYRSEVLFKVEGADNVSADTRKDVLRKSLLSMGLIWIFIFTPLYSGMSQIQTEKSSGTYPYLLKLPKCKPMILFSKQTAVILQCFLTLVLFMILGSLLGNGGAYILRLVNIPVAILIILTISSLGYFLGFILRDGALSAIITPLLTLPTMLLTSINTRTALDPVMKFMPTHSAGLLIRDIVYADGIRIVNILTVAGIAVLFFSLSVILFNKKEPM